MFVIVFEKDGEPGYEPEYVDRYYSPTTSIRDARLYRDVFKAQEIANLFPGRASVYMLRLHKMGEPDAVHPTEKT